MNKVSFLKKVLYYLYLKDLSEKIPLEYNFCIHTIILLSKMVLFYLMPLFATKLNKFIRVFLVFILLYFFIELLYILTIRKYNKEIPVREKQI